MKLPIAPVINGLGRVGKALIIGTVHKFGRPPSNRGQFRGYRPSPRPDGPKKPKRPWGVVHSLATLLGLSLALFAVTSMWTSSPADAATCNVTSVHDGDTIRCGSERVRIENIDAPELPDSPKCTDRRRNGWCDYDLGYRSRDALQAFLATGSVTIVRNGEDKYGRTLARLSVDEKDAGDYLIERGLARKWK